VANNRVLNLYQHVNSPEGRLYLSRQLFEEAVHVQSYLTLLDTYVPDEAERHAAFAAVENIPSIKREAEFCFRWIDCLGDLDELRTREDRRAALLNLICFAAGIEGLFFYGARPPCVIAVRSSRRGGCLWRGARRRHQRSTTTQADWLWSSTA
jgi:ribonucleoside-diphosphate reductase beta chain